MEGAERQQAALGGHGGGRKDRTTLGGLCGACLGERKAECSKHCLEARISGGLRVFVRVFCVPDCSMPSNDGGWSHRLKRQPNRPALRREGDVEDRFLGLFQNLRDNEQN